MAILEKKRMQRIKKIYDKGFDCYVTRHRESLKDAYRVLHNFQDYLDKYSETNKPLPISTIKVMGDVEDMMSILRYLLRFNEEGSEEREKDEQ